MLFTKHNNKMFHKNWIWIMAWFHSLWRFQLGRSCRKVIHTVHKPFVQSCHLHHNQFPSLGWNQFHKLLQFPSSNWYIHHFPSRFPRSSLQSSNLHELGRYRIRQPIKIKNGNLIINLKPHGLIVDFNI